MINLIKNEFTKIFHKKAIYIFMIIIAAFAALNVVLTKIADNYLTDEKLSSTKDTNIDHFDLAVIAEREQYISNKTEAETYSYIKSYDNNSWEYYYLNENLVSPIRCTIEAQIDNNHEEEKKCQNKIDEILAFAKKGKWREDITNKKNEAEAEIKALKEKLEVSENKDEKETLKNEIKKLEYQIEGYNYRLDLDIAPTKSGASTAINDYVSNSISLLEMSKKDNSIPTRKEELERRQLEKTVKENKYKLDNKIKIYDTSSAIGLMKENAESISFIILIAVILIAGTSVGEEFTKGTIKQLLIKPYSRTKILLAKYITILLVFLLLFVYSFVVNTIASLFMGDIKSITSEIIVYNFASKSIESMGLIKYTLMYFVADLPVYLILLTISFMIAALTGNTAISMSISMAYYMMSAVTQILSSIGSKYAMFLPSNNWYLTTYLFGGLSYNEHLTFTSSFIVCAIAFIVPLIISFVAFKKKNIKNI